MSFRRALPGPECKRAAPWCRKGLGFRDLGFGFRGQLAEGGGA